jgi:putative endopeptidase
VREIVEELAARDNPRGSLEQRIADTYESFLDTAAIDAAGLAPAKPYLDRIAAAADNTALLTLMGEPGYPSVIDAGTSIDRTNPTRNTYFVSTGGLGLPDRDNYLIDNPRNLEMRTKYKELLAFMLGRAGYTDPAAAAERVYELEKQFAAIGWDRALARDPQITTNRMSAADLAVMPVPFPSRVGSTAAACAPTTA